MISLLDYGAGNVRSLRNAISALGFSLTEIERPEDILKAERLIFPGVGAFGAAMQRLHAQGYVEPLKQYLAEGRPFFGICIGLQTLFEGSEESPGIPQIRPTGKWKSRQEAGTGPGPAFTHRFGAAVRSPHGLERCTPDAHFTPVCGLRRGEALFRSLLPSRARPGECRLDTGHH